MCIDAKTALEFQEPLQELPQTPRRPVSAPRFADIRSIGEAPHHLESHPGNARNLTDETLVCKGGTLVPYRLTLDVFCIESCESWDNGFLGEVASCGDCGTADAGEIVSIGADDAFDDAEIAEAAKLAG